MMISYVSLISLVLLLAYATWSDFRDRRIPNWLTFSGVLLGLLLNTMTMGASGLGFAILGTVVGLLVFLPIYALGRMGAGDVKLMAMTGAFLGPAGVLWAAAFSAIAGGVIAALWIVYELGLRSSFYRAIATFSMIQVPGSGVLKVPDNSPLKSKMPYALAIGAGSLVAAWHMNLL